MPEYMTLPEAAELLRSSERSVYEWLRTGKLRAGRAGRRWLFTRADVEDFVRGRNAPYADADRAPSGGVVGREDLASALAAVPAAPAFTPPSAPAAVAGGSRPNANPLAGMRRDKNKHSK